jgi:outer membrane protein assembly factor BamD (BamD/ComL family)
LLTRFPDSKYAVDAADRLSLLEEALRARSGASRVRELEARIADLTAQQQRLRAELDSTQLQNDVLRRSATRLEEQLRTLRLELRQLKEIDLKPRPPGVRPLLRE